MKLTKHTTILIIPLLILSGSLTAAEFPDDGYWEEYGSEELPIILEFGLSLKGEARDRILGYRPELSSLDSSILIFDNRLSSAKGTLFEMRRVDLSLRVSGDKLDRQLARLKSRFGENWSADFITERDPGEDFFDFTAGNVSYYDDDLILTLGNYSAGFAEGLVLWRGFRWGAYPEQPIAPLKTDFLRGFSSTAENGSLFGGGVNMSYGILSAFLLYSDARWDASGDEEGVLTLQETGWHVTESEKENEDRLRERLLAGRLCAEPIEGIRLGFSASQAEYSPPFTEQDSIKYTFAFAGDENRLLGGDIKAEYGSLFLSAEYAETESGGSGLVGNLLIKSEYAAFNLSGRNISKDFRNIRSLYPEGDETGYSLGFSLRAWRGGMVNLYLDAWEKDWRTYFYEMPPEGSTASFNLNQKAGDFEISFRLRRKENNPQFSGTTRDQFRFNLEKEFRHFIAKFRFETIHSESESGYHRGYLTTFGLSRDILWGNLDLCLTGFEVPDYNCRIYRYEEDVPGMFTLPFFYGAGANVNLLFESAIVAKLRIGFKTALTFYRDRPNNLSEATDKRFSIYLNYAVFQRAE